MLSHVHRNGWRYLFGGFGLDYSYDWYREHFVPVQGASMQPVLNPDYEELDLAGSQRWENFAQ